MKKKYKEPYELDSIVAGKLILSFNTEIREYKKKAKNGKVYIYQSPFYWYEAECLYCGSVSIVGSGAMQKRINKNVIHCRECAEQRYGAIRKTDNDAPALQVDKHFPNPLSFNYFIWGMQSC